VVQGAPTLADARVHITAASEAVGEIVLSVGAGSSDARIDDGQRYSSGAYDGQEGEGNNFHVCCVL